MILLDTNVISEPWKPAPDTAVLTWLDAQALETLFISAISIAELRFGIALMPSGMRQTILHD
jgi:predicted nucleic acid-binding protein